MLKVKFMYVLKNEIRLYSMVEQYSISHPAHCFHKKDQPVTDIQGYKVIGMYSKKNHQHHHHVHEGLGMLSCSLILKMQLVPPSLPWSSCVPSSFWSILQCLFWCSVCVHPLYVL
jgi:hypothetical protein